MWDLRSVARLATVIVLAGFPIPAMSQAPQASLDDAFVGAPITSQRSALQAVPSANTTNANLLKSNTRTQALSLTQVATQSGLDPNKAADYEKVSGIVDSVIKALDDRDPVAMSRFYASDPTSTYFGPLLYDREGRMVGAQSRLDYFRGLATGLSFFKSVDCHRSGDDIFRIGDRMALWTATGTNFVTFRNDVQTVTPWRWTMVLEKMGDGQWMIVHEHASFGDSRSFK
jgi:ketosteroid isomerase-like protein